MRGTAALLALTALLAACGQHPAGPVISPTPRYATVAAVVDGVVYVAGGIERGPVGDATTAAVEAYDPGERTWTRCAPMPTARSFGAAAALDGRIYVFGGLDAAGKALDVVEVYDPSRDAWSACPPMETALSRLAAVTHGGRGVLVAGGLDASDRNSAKQFWFAPRENNAWRGWSPLPTARHGFGLADADDGTERMFAIGGYDESGPLSATDRWGVGTVRALDAAGNPRWPGATSTNPDTGEVTKLDRDYKGYLWESAPPLHEARGFHAVARIGRRIYAVGGRSPVPPRTEILDMDAVPAGWQQAAPLPRDLCRFSLVAWDGHLLAFGGETDFGGSVNTDVLEYDPAVDTWSVR